MKYFQLLVDCKDNLASCCSDYGIASYLYIIKKALTIIQIAVPIILIVMGSVQLIKMMMNPDEKKNKKSFINKFIAAVIVFIIPLAVNIIIGLMPESFEISNCWKSAEDIVDNTINGPTKYKVIYNNNDNKEDNSSSNYNNTSSNSKTSSKTNSSGSSYITTYNQNKYSDRVCSSGCSSIISNSGCSTSAYSAAVYLLTGKKVNLVSVANDMCSVGAYICGAGGSGATIVSNSKLKQKYGIGGDSVTRSYSEFVEQLKKGRVILVSVRNGSQNDRNGQTGFNATKNGHYILLTDYDKSTKKINVYNPNANRNGGYRTQEDINKYIVNVGGTGSWYLEKK